MEVYTRTGDNGTTSLIGGKRVSKTDLRLEAYGTVDELSAFISELYDSINENTVLNGKIDNQQNELLYIISKLMDVEALLAADRSYYERLPKVDNSDIGRLESGIDTMSALLPKLGKFTLPIGHTLISKAHICRTVCRRAERVSLQCLEIHDVSREAIQFLNRLSDYLYTLSRLLSLKLGVEEKVWEGK